MDFEYSDRSKALLEELARLHKLPRVTKKLRYQTPVSTPLQTEELMFECFHGRVTLLDTGALIADIQRQLRSKSELLHTQWEVRDVTTPVGAFRLRYVIERQRSSMDGPLAGSGPMSGTFRYGVSAWEAEPVTPLRGETPEEALKNVQEAIASWIEAAREWKMDIPKPSPPLARVG